LFRPFLSMAGHETAAPGYHVLVEPIPETVETLEELARFTTGDLRQRLVGQATQVRELVPDCVGLSLALIEDGVTLTLVATSEEIAVLDGVQYLFGGPCVDSAKGEQVMEFHNDDVLDERMWQHFAQATSAAAVASTLTLPVLAEGAVVGSVNLYAASRNAFGGLHRDIARIFDAWAPGAVTNADLSFSTRESAERAPEKLREDLRVQMAVGIIAASHDIELAAARDELSDAARRAGVSEATLAEAIIAIGGPHDHE
jgi:GAF domain-containing protein